MKKIKHFLGFHRYNDCIETGEEKFEFCSLFDIWITRFLEYRCQICGRKFWMPKGDFEMAKMEETTYEMTMNAAKYLVNQNRIDEAIDLLKLK